MLNMLCALYLQDCGVTVSRLQAWTRRNKDSALSDDGKRCAAGQLGHFSGLSLFLHGS